MSLDPASLLAAVPTPSLVLTLEWIIVDANGAYERMSGRRRSELLDRTLVEAFPANPADPEADGYPELVASLERVRDTGLTDAMPVQRHDVHDPATGAFAVRYWSPTNIPVFDDTGQLTAILHQVEEVTELVAQRRRNDLVHTLQRQGMTGDQIDAFASAQDLRAAAEALETAALRRQSAREHILLRLITASTQALSTKEKLRALAAAAIPVLSDICAVYLLDHPLPAGRPVAAPIHAWRLAAPTSTGVIGPIPDRTSVWSGGDPASQAIATAATVLITYAPGAAPPWAAAAGVATAIEEGRIHSSALVPVVVDGIAHAFIAFGAGPDRPPYTDDERALFELVAAHTAVAMQQGERYDHVRNTSLTLQRAMLTPPPVLTDVDIEVRYRPAGEGAEVGGDWHDVFHLDGGAPETVGGGLAVVVGDVAGHDVSAATVMGQIRSMLRGFAIHDRGRPGDTLSALNHVIRQTRLTLLATCVLVHVAQGAAPGLELTWSNAGHPSPIVLDADGTITVLDEPRDPALGATAAGTRTSATRHLADGSTLLLFSDGLFERRGIDYDESVACLRRTLSAHTGLGLGALCDELVRSAPHDDDVVLIALRRRRPPFATVAG